MDDFKYIDFVPPWARGGIGRFASQEETPNLGFQPESAPRLPTRIVPRNQDHSISSLTLSDSVSITQKILNYSAYEYVYGVRLDFADLRQVDNSVLEIARLRVEPFEQGSFIIPGALSEDEIELNVNNLPRKFSGVGVLLRFVQILEGVSSADHQFAVSIGALQAIEELGKVLKREAAFLEYQPIGFGRDISSVRPIRIDTEFIETVSSNRKFRLDPRSAPDDLSGTLTAVDIVEGKFKIRLESRSSIRGSYTPFMEERMTRALGKLVRLAGVTEYVGGKPKFIKAFDVEILDDSAS